MCTFRNVNINKSCGPDKLSGKLLKSCHKEIADIFAYIFNLSLKLMVIPNVWKKAEIVPVPKKSKVESMNDLRPVALTSVAMKLFEKLVLKLLLHEVKGHLDPYQFAYKEGRNVEDACIILINNILKHLEEKRTYARLLFIDFSSAFNTIQPHIMVRKLLDIDVNVHIVAWVLDFLTNRAQYVKVNHTHSDPLTLNTGAPQGCVLSPTLYTIYTNEYRSNNANTRLIKFADDSVIQGLMSNSESENAYSDEVNRFTSWCKENYLLLNVRKTKEMIIDFRLKKTEIPPLRLENEVVDVVETYRYLGFILDNKLNWHSHIDSVCGKLNSRLFFLKKLKSFDLTDKVIRHFYRSIVESIVTFGISCWGGSITTGDRLKIDRIIKRAEILVGMTLKSQITLYEEFSISKVRKIIEDQNHPLLSEFQISQRSGKCLSCKTRTERFKKSFIPAISRRLSQSDIRIYTETDTNE